MSLTDIKALNESVDKPTIEEILLDAQQKSHPLRTKKGWTDLFELTKPRITLLVIITTIGGLFLAPPQLGWLQNVGIVFSICVLVSAASTLNCWWERDVDALMKRTRSRPLPDKRLPASYALIFGLLLGAASIPLLAVSTNHLTTYLGALALGLYVLAYTPLKRKSWLALWVGAIPGAMPPLMGWTAATNRLDLGAIVLFGILFLWQLPHFIAISLFRDKDYLNAGFQVLPNVRGVQAAKWHAMVYTIALSIVTWLPVAIGMASWLYAILSTLASAAFLGFSIYGLSKAQKEPWARKFFLVSLIHLTLIFIALPLDNLLIQ